MKLSVYRGIPAKVLPVAEPIVTELGYELWDIEYYKEGTDQILCITLDSEEGINIEDCEKVSRALDLPLDEADPIPCEYCLQVSSPGIERDLKRDSHFEQCIGMDIKIKLIRPLDGQREFSGVLESYDAGNVQIKLEDGSGFMFNKKEASYIKLDDFGGEI